MSLYDVSSLAGRHLLIYFTSVVSEIKITVFEKFCGRDETMLLCPFYCKMATNSFDRLMFSDEI